MVNLEKLKAEEMSGKLASSAINTIEDFERAGAVMATSALQARAMEVRNTRVNWQPYVQSMMISKDEYEIIIRIDNSNQRADTLKNKPVQSIDTLVTLMGKISKDQTVQYIVTLIDDLLQEDKSRVELLHQYGVKSKESIWKPFFAMLLRPDTFTVTQASRIVSKLACWSVQQIPPSELHYFLHWIIKEQLKTTNQYLQSAARCLQMLLRIPAYRGEFVALKGVEAITDLLHCRISYQNQYQLIFCVWVVTFDIAIADLVSKIIIIPVMSDILSDAAKEKVIRIILATFRNFLEKPSEKEFRTDNALAMIRCKVLKQLSLLEGKKYEDSDISDDIAFINQTLLLQVQDLSSFDEYTSELKSGQLAWSPVHKSEKFWRENAARLNEKNFELLKILAKLLESSKDPLVLSVAAHDLGEYIRHYPHGKNIIEQLGGKTYVMALLSHEDPNVRYEALLAVQKLMVHNWEYLGKQLETPKEQQGNKQQK